MGGYDKNYKKSKKIFHPVDLVVVAVLVVVIVVLLPETIVQENIV